MSIDRISKIKNHRIFHEFVWSQDLLEFKEKNLFYGWNATGKTTLSNLFRSIEKRTPINEGDVEFVICGNKIDGAELSTIQALPQVRVFNKNFISDNVFPTHGAVAPIFFLGEENIEKQKQVEKLKKDFEEATKETEGKEAEKVQSERIFENFKKEQAKSIKDLLSSSGGNNSYNNYDKRSFQAKCDELLKLSESDQKAKILNDQDFNSKKDKKEASPKGKLPFLEFTYPDTLKLTDKVIEVLGKTVVSAVIDALKNDPDLSRWVKTGFEKHRRDNSSECLFCGQDLPAGRLQELEAHFNDKYNAFIAEIENLSRLIQSEIGRLGSCNPPNRLVLYNHLLNEYDAKSQELSQDLDGVKAHLQKLRDILDEKAKAPFQAIEKELNVASGNTEIITGLNSIIRKHNSETGDFQSAINVARTSIEESMVAYCLADYTQKKEDIKVLNGKVQNISDKAANWRSEIHEIETEIEEHRRPADELNADIYSYLGRSELTFEIKETGYQISRNGTVAEDLSEGEKTAIAFLYFLKSLGDKSFSLQDGIVVIDDPVSSLDTNALFHAFGFMKDRTKDAGQLFILTHNHMFFRQVKNWFNHLPNQRKRDTNLRPARFYMLASSTKADSISSSIVQLDKLLHEYESEYHYLFSLVYGAANSEEKSSLQQNYHLPNIARRLLESFLAFRQPSKSGELHQQLDLIDYDVAKKTRILRFLHTHSHAGQIPDPEHDPSILLETKQVLDDLLHMIQKEDERHFDQMKELVTK